eukprot:m.33531 g.33531  ORF g.33531 m.33531 type:complete len:123 (-) comp5124_c0_seq1:3854-4222(-)
MDSWQSGTHSSDSLSGVAAETDSLADTMDMECSTLWHGLDHEDDPLTAELESDYMSMFSPTYEASAEPALGGYVIDSDGEVAPAGKRARPATPQGDAENAMLMLPATPPQAYASRQGLLYSL